MSKWWINYPWRMIQTNLRETDMADISAEQYIKSLLDFNATVALINVGGIIASYATELPFQHQSEYLTGQSLQQIIAECHKQGIKVIARMDFSKIRTDVYQQHPDWAFRKADGSVVDYNGNIHACINGGYQQQAVSEIIKEVIEKLDIDGLFFNMSGMQLVDYSYNYVGICHCSACKQAYKEFCGEELPDDIADIPSGKLMPHDLSKYLRREPYTMKYLSFISKRSAELNMRMYAYIKELNPNIAVSGFDFIRTEANTEYGRNAVKPQYSASSSTRYSRGVDNTCIPSNSSVDFEGFYYRHIAVSPYLQKMRLYQSLANLGGLDYYLIGRLDNHEDKSAFQNIKEVFDFHKRNEKSFAGLTSLASTLLIVARGRLASAAESGFVRALSESHIPFDEAKPDDVLKGDLSKYQLVIVAGEIPQSLKNKLDEYVELGGTLLVTAPVRGESLKSLGITKTHPSKEMRSAMFKEETGLFTDSTESTLTLLGDQYFYPECAEGVGRYGKLIPPHMYGPPEKCYYTDITKYPAVTVNIYGKGKGIYVPWTPSEIYFEQGIYNCFLFLNNLLIKIAGVKPLGNLTPMAETQLSLSVDKKSVLLQIVNGSGHFGNTFFQALPLCDSHFCLDYTAERVKSLMQNKDIPFENKNGTLSFTVDKINDYDCIEIMIKNED